ncbi:MAG: ISL3 family transposase [Chloroflexota bacterium]|nr:ISL3 family transposase [Chloroflexota bacterium]
MHLRTVLNAVYRHKGFIYRDERFSSDGTCIEVSVRPRQGSRGLCSRCGQPGPTYDTQKQRTFWMVPIWSIAVCLLYAPRRINCRHCQAVCIERIPWAISQKSSLTSAFAHCLASWARSLSWKEVAHRWQTTWEKVAQSLEWFVDWGLEHRQLADIYAIGVDEIQGSKGHRYKTLVYQIDAGAKRLLWIGQERTKESFGEFFTEFDGYLTQVRVVCSDMWQGYLAVIAEQLPQALNVLDRFHIVKKLNEAIDQTRRDEVKRLREQGKEAYLSKTRWIWLKRLTNLTGGQYIKLNELLTMNLRTVKAHFFKEHFNRFWDYTQAAWAERFLDTWCTDVMRHRSLPHLKKFVGTLRSHKDLIMNYFRAKSSLRQAFSSGIVEGFNNKAKLSLRKSYGFRTVKYQDVALYHALGNLPEPEATHRFG